MVLRLICLARAAERQDPEVEGDAESSGRLGMAAVHDGAAQNDGELEDVCDGYGVAAAAPVNLEQNKGVHEK